MLRIKYAVLPAALTLALAFTGCGKPATNNATDTTTEPAAEATADAATLEIPDELAGAAEELRSFDPSEVTDETAELDTYAEAPDAEDLALDQVDQVEEAEEAEVPEETEEPEEAEESEESEEAEEAEEVADAAEAEEAYEAAESAYSASSSYVPLYNGGMKIELPSDWEVEWEGAGKYSFLSADRQAYGFVNAWKKESGHVYDVVEMMSYMPKSLVEEGYTGIQVIDTNVLPSDNGTLCDAYICLKATKGGTDYIRWYEFLESKSYVTGLAMASTLEGWADNFEELGNIACSVAFAPGEGI